MIVPAVEQSKQLQINPKKNHRTSTGFEPMASVLALRCSTRNLSNQIFDISIYTLSDLGDLSNLIGSLSRTIQQYSPPSEWIRCDLGVFPVFFRERSFKSRQNPRADFF